MVQEIFTSFKFVVERAAEKGTILRSHKMLKQPFVNDRQQVSVLAQTFQTDLKTSNFKGEITKGALT